MSKSKTKVKLYPHKLSKFIRALNASRLVTDGFSSVMKSLSQIGYSQSTWLSHPLRIKHLQLNCFDLCHSFEINFFIKNRIKMMSSIYRQNPF
jgi:hypothetical protein